MTKRLSILVLLVAVAGCGKGVRTLEVRDRAVPPAMSGVIVRAESGGWRMTPIPSLPLSSGLRHAHDVCGGKGAVLLAILRNQRRDAVGAVYGCYGSTGDAS